MFDLILPDVSLTYQKVNLKIIQFFSDGKIVFLTGIVSVHS